MATVQTSVDQDNTNEMMRAMYDRVKVMDRQVQDMKKQIVEMNIRSYDKDVENQVMEYKIKELSAEKHSQDEKVQQMKNELMVENHYIKSKIQELTDELDSLKNSCHESPVAFHARRSSSKIFEDGSTIVFDTVITNAGDFYSPSVGVFLCPVSGYYFFAVSLLSTDSRSQAAIIMDNASKTSRSRHKSRFFRSKWHVNSDPDHRMSIWISCLCTSSSVFIIIPSSRSLWPILLILWIPLV